MAKVLLYPGSFDPITNGHVDVVKKAMKVFDDVRIIVMVNRDKSAFLTLDERVELAYMAFPENRIIPYDGMINELISREQDRGHDVFIARGIRNTTDLEYEQTVQAFTEVFGATTIYFTPDPENIRISSSFVRHLISAKVDKEVIRKYLPNSAYTDELYEMVGLGGLKWY